MLLLPVLIVLLTISRIVVPSSCCTTSCLASIVIIGKLGGVTTCCLKWLAISVVGWIHGGLQRKKKSQIITNNSQSRFINAFIVGDVFELIIQHHFKLELKLRLIVLKLDKRCLNKTLVSSINIFVVCLCVKMNFELSGRKITLELHFLRRQKNAICHPRLWEIG